MTLGNDTDHKKPDEDIIFSKQPGDLEIDIRQRDIAKAVKAAVFKVESGEIDSATLAYAPQESLGSAALIDAQKLLATVYYAVHAAKADTALKMAARDPALEARYAGILRRDETARIAKKRLERLEGDQKGEELAIRFLRGKATEEELQPYVKNKDNPVLLRMLGTFLDRWTGLGVDIEAKSRVAKFATWAIGAYNQTTSKTTNLPAINAHLSVLAVLVGSDSILDSDEKLSVKSIVDYVSSNHITMEKGDWWKLFLVMLNRMKQVIEDLTRADYDRRRSTAPVEAPRSAPTSPRGSPRLEDSSLPKSPVDFLAPDLPVPPAKAKLLEPPPKPPKTEDAIPQEASALIAYLRTKNFSVRIDHEGGLDIRALRQTGQLTVELLNALRAQRTEIDHYLQEELTRPLPPEPPVPEPSLVEHPESLVAPVTVTPPAAPTPPPPIPAHLLRVVDSLPIKKVGGQFVWPQDLQDRIESKHHVRTNSNAGRIIGCLVHAFLHTPDEAVLAADLHTLIVTSAAGLPASWCSSEIAKLKTKRGYDIEIVKEGKSHKSYRLKSEYP